MLEKGPIANSLLGEIPTACKLADGLVRRFCRLPYIEKSLNKSTFKMEVYVERLLLRKAVLSVLVLRTIIRNNKE